MTLGPFQLRGRRALPAVAPARSIRATEHGIAYDITWLDTKRPVFRQLGAGIIVGGRAVSPVAGYDGFGRQEGWVEADGERFALGPARPISARATTTGAPATASADPAATWGCSTRTAASGSSSRTSGSGATMCSTTSATRASAAATLARRVHRMRFEPDTNLLLSGEVDLVFADGSVKTMAFERLGHQIAFLRCGMYGGPNGGTPDGDLWHGMAVAHGRRGRRARRDLRRHTTPTCAAEAGGAGPAPLSRHLRRRGHLRPRRALRHPLLRGLQGRCHGLLAPRSRP